MAWQKLSHDGDEWVRSCATTDLLLCNVGTPPPPVVVKCNSYGCFCDMDQRIGGGGIIQDHHGRWLVGCFSGDVGDSAFKAEVVALRDVLELAWDRGFRKVICDVDCAALVTTLADETAVQMHLELRSWLCIPFARC